MPNFPEFQGTGVSPCITYILARWKSLMSDVTKRNQVASLSLLWLILWLLFFADDDSCVLSAATSHTKDHKSNQRILRDIAGFVTLVWGFVLFGFVGWSCGWSYGCYSLLMMTHAATSHTKVIKWWGYCRICYLSVGFCFVLALCVWLILWLIFLLIVTHVCFLQQQATQKYLKDIKGYCRHTQKKPTGKGKRAHPHRQTDASQYSQ